MATNDTDIDDMTSAAAKPARKRAHKSTKDSGHEKSSKRARSNNTPRLSRVAKKAQRKAERRAHLDNEMVMARAMQSAILPIWLDWLGDMDTRDAETIYNCIQAIGYVSTPLDKVLKRMMVRMADAARACPSSDPRARMGMWRGVLCIAPIMRNWASYILPDVARRAFLADYATALDANRVDLIVDLRLCQATVMRCVLEMAQCSDCDRGWWGVDEIVMNGSARMVRDCIRMVLKWRPLVDGVDLAILQADLAALRAAPNAGIVTVLAGLLNRHASYSIPTDPDSTSRLNRQLALDTALTIAHERREFYDAKPHVCITTVHRATELQCIFDEPLASSDPRWIVSEMGSSQFVDRSVTHVDA